MDRRSLIFIFVMTTGFLLLNNFLFDRRIDQALQNEQVTLVEEPSTIQQHNNEHFYVLQNDKQQVVFSNLGGAIAEINLVVTKDLEKIGFDQEILNKSPKNALFPNFAYSIVDSSGKLQQLNPSLGGYTPLLRRSLKNSSGECLFQVPAAHYATTLLKEGETTPTEYTVNQFTSESIEFIGKTKDATIFKTYRLSKDAPYLIELETKIQGDATGLWLTSGITEVDLLNGSYSPVMHYQTHNGKKTKVKKLSLPKKSDSYDSLKPVWSSISNGFLGLIIDPLSAHTMGMKIEKIEGQLAMSRLSVIDPENQNYPPEKFPGYEWQIPYKASAMPMKYLIYAGPFDKNLLTQVDLAMTESGTHDQLATVVATTGWFSSIINPFVKLLSVFLNTFYSLTKSWGFSIILLTLLLRIIIYPLNQWALNSQKKMQEIAPKQQAIKDKFKADPKRLQMELAMLYRNERVNPFMGCLPMLLQFPFLIGMYQLLQSNLALRGVAFIPGWIDNLAAPDVLFSWSAALPFFGTSFHLLPFVLGALTYIQGKMNTWMQTQKGELSDQQKQMNQMATIMPLVMMFIFYNMASGLNLYWIFSSLFGIVQQWFVMRASKKSPKSKKAKR